MSTGYLLSSAVTPRQQAAVGALATGPISGTACKGRKAATQSGRRAPGHVMREVVRDPPRLACGVTGALMLRVLPSPAWAHPSRLPAAQDPRRGGDERSLPDR